MVFVAQGDVVDDVVDEGARNFSLEFPVVRELPSAQPRDPHATSPRPCGRGPFLFVELA